MSHISPLISDLALILAVAGITTIIFKMLKQPIVLGYIVAGFLCSPHFAIMPSVLDKTNVQTWADIGVIFLLFALGLEFSFKKLMKVGGPAAVAALIIISGMIFLGFSAGVMMGWNNINSLFLGGMIAMSSTSIIYKALDDLALRKEPFSNMVLGILVIEDIVAIILMVVLSTVAAKNSSSDGGFIYSIMKLGFFLLIWFTVGIYIIPSTLRKTTKWLNDETLLIVSLGLCLLMVYFATIAGFSAALGAFVMGSILAETAEAERIARITTPVKNLFAAIFFTSVGMMVDPSMIAAHIWPIIIITLVILFGQIIFGTIGVVISGQPLKTAIQCSFCLTQIGEFAFIIAGLGVSMHVTSGYLYPIVVAVSVITTFITPYMIKAAEPMFPHIVNHMPKQLMKRINRYTSGAQAVSQPSVWRSFLFALGKITIIHSVIVLAIIILFIEYIAPFLASFMPTTWSSIICAITTIILTSPFLRAIIAKKNHSKELYILWDENRYNRGYIIGLLILRFTICVGFMQTILVSLFPTVHHYILLIISIILISLMIASRMLKKHSMLIERRFKQNFHIRENIQTQQEQRRPRFAGGLLTRDLHLINTTLPPNSEWGGKTLEELKLKFRYGVDIVAIFRDGICYNIPGGKTRIFPSDRLQIIGNDTQIQSFTKEIERQQSVVIESDLNQNEMHLRQILVGEGSFLEGRTLSNSGIRDKFHCLVVAVNRTNVDIRDPNADFIFQKNDFIWIVGLEEDIFALAHQKAMTKQ